MSAPTTGVREIQPEEAAAFRENGWVKLDNLITPDLAARLLEAAKGLLGTDGTGHKARRGIDIDFEWFSEYQQPGFEGLEPFRSVAFDPAIGKAAHALGVRRPGVGVRYMRDQVVCRHPAGQRKSEPAPPHQDFSAAVFDRMGYVNLWIALNEIPPERGSLRFYNGSHREGPMGWRDRDGNIAGSGKPLLEVYPDFIERCPRSEPLHLMPGDATAHTMLTVHESPGNFTDEPRWNLINLYIPEDVVYTGLVRGGIEQVVDVGQPLDHPKFPVIWRPTD